MLGCDVGRCKTFLEIRAVVQIIFAFVSVLAVQAAVGVVAPDADPLHAEHMRCANRVSVSAWRSTRASRAWPSTITSLEDIAPSLHNSDEPLRLSYKDQAMNLACVRQVFR